MNFILEKLKQSDWILELCIFSKNFLWSNLNTSHSIFECSTIPLEASRTFAVLSLHQKRQVYHAVFAGRLLNAKFCIQVDSSWFNGVGRCIHGVEKG